ncbi:hypothetical protein HK414_26215 [Ramlibacter terrae]|uniref:Uncharacterized protein n=1 Tax=Ramlibacter terrae TaxID=2732511 RepID=A0ABX6P614_9BURK|nr:hypothetical protein HK414_26215 [Ramlibacter terrae]
MHTIVSDKLAKVAPVMERVAQHFPIGQRRWVLEHISRSTPEDRPPSSAWGCRPR